MKKICIFGAGAVGGFIAANLAHAGLEVSIVARGAHLAAIRERGLRLITAQTDFTVSVLASDDPAELGPQDLIISTVKAQALGAAAPAFKPLLHDDTPVIFAVNGIPWWYFHSLADDAQKRLTRLDPEGRLWRDIGPDRALGCVIRSPNEILSPGVIRNNASASSFVVGEPDGSDSPRLREAVALMRQGLPGARGTQDIRSEIWTKLALNVPSSLMSALTVSTGPEIFADAETRALYRRLGEETDRVAAAHGVSANFDLDAQMRSAGNHRHPPSMLQDLLAGRPLEIDAQLGAVQDMARQAHVPTPLLDVTLALLTLRANSEFAAGLRADPGR